METKVPRTLRQSVALTLLAAFFAVVAGLFSGGPLLALRKGQGRFSFLGALAFVSALLIAMKATTLLLPLGVSALLVFLYAEFDQIEFSVRSSATLAVLITLVLSVIATGWYAHSSGTDYYTLSMNAVTSFLGTVQKFQPNLKLQAEDLRAQLPSGVIVTYMVIMWFSILLEKSFRFWSGIKVNLRQPGELIRFRLPEFLVWPFILSFALSFLAVPVSESWKVIALNVFNVVSFAYFLQGIAIVSWVLKAFRIGTIWRWLFYFTLISQMFLFVAFIGLIDLWVDFRHRISRRKTTGIV